MTIFSDLIRTLYSSRLTQIDNFRHNGAEIQHQQMEYLLKAGNNCKYLKDRGINSQSDFQNLLPVVCYEDIAEDVTKVLEGQQNVLWSKPTRWFAKSSGTTNDKSKYIPITEESLANCHFRAGKDVMAIFCTNFPDSKALSGKSLTLGGSHRIAREGNNILVGDLSAILIENTPSWFSFKRLPSAKVALTPDFQQKIELICQETIDKNITNFAGVPSWNLVLMNKILEYTGKSNIHEVWPDMSLFVHGGISFKPYRSQYEKLFPDPDMKYMETYNASEGFFALQDDPNDESMLLMLDYGIYYEFIPMSSLNDHSTIIPLEGVRTGVNYAMVISTTGGLWRYMIGDTVEFTSTSPYKIKITGRTKQHINAFGEELMVDNAERALREACRATGAVIDEYTVAPVFMEGRARGYHQWLIEFKQAPDSLDSFTRQLDETLKSVNSDYEAKRAVNSTLNEPLITIAPRGVFYRWMQTRGKVGGQNKVPRLSSDRKIMEQLIECIKLIKQP